MTKTLKIHPNDNVAVALEDLESNGIVIKRGHKIALVDIKKGEQIAEWRRRKFLWIFILSTISVVILDALLMY